jgi:hypothetical protein
MPGVAYSQRDELFKCETCEEGSANLADVEHDPHCCHAPGLCSPCRGGDHRQHMADYWDQRRLLGARSIVPGMRACACPECGRNRGQG